ncbi:hypothetical protein [Hafnia alvei]|uniref:hypothetical protein n=1 Tax=Hafnia alvei TaxID=569 RepID=UPI0009BB13B2|nr:hypothetical protein [Hafnia alvei]
MKKIIVLLIVTIFGTTSISTIACPKGEHPYDGTGSHHKYAFLIDETLCFAEEKSRIKFLSEFNAAR